MWCWRSARIRGRVSETSSHVSFDGALKMMHSDSHAFFAMFLSTYSHSLKLELGEDLGVIQEIDDSKEEEIKDIIQKARLYLQNTVYQDPIYASVKDNCKNQDPNCAFWAVSGNFLLMPCECFVAATAVLSSLAIRVLLLFC